MSTPVTHEKLQAALKTRADIRQAILFGSLANGAQQPDSDIDIALDLGRPISAKEKLDLMEEIAALTGRSVDLVDLQTVGEPLLGQILKTGKRLLGTNTLYAELIKRHVFDEADFMPYYRRILKHRRDAWIGK